MTVGKGGIYDAETQELMTRLAARGVIVIVTQGSRGSGFSVAMDIELLASMPAMLEDVARQVRDDLRKLRS